MQLVSEYTKVNTIHDLNQLLVVAFPNTFHNAAKQLL